MSDVGTYQVQFQEVERMARYLDRYPEVAREELGQAMSAAVIHTVSEIQPLTPVYQGRLRSSIGGRVEMGGAVGSIGGEITGIVDTDVEYALPVELGRKPGSWPPLEPLQRWAHLVLGDEDAAGAVRAAIARRGTKGAFMFAQGWRRARTWVNRRFEQALARIVARVGKGR